MQSTIPEGHWPFQAKTVGDLYKDPVLGASNYQVGGNHYQTGIQPWDAMEAWMTEEQFQGFLLGSAIAYLARFNTTGVVGKGGATDIRKAKHYLEKLLENISENGETP